MAGQLSKPSPRRSCVSKRSKGAAQTLRCLFAKWSMEAVSWHTAPYLPAFAVAHGLDPRQARRCQPSSTKESAREAFRLQIAISKCKVHSRSSGSITQLFRTKVARLVYFRGSGCKIARGSTRRAFTKLQLENRNCKTRTQHVNHTSTSPAQKSHLVIAKVVLLQLKPPATAHR